MKHLASLFLGALLLAGATAAAQPVPEALKPSGDQERAFTLHATGYQIYEVRATKEDPARFEWAFVAPEAELTDASGAKVGRHYGGPTWEGLDGSKVQGEVRAKDTSRSAGSIPWLLLAARTPMGPGLFAQVTYIQRLDTSGGAAPAPSPTAGQVGQILKVPYRATYAFFRAKP